MEKIKAREYIGQDQESGQKYVYKVNTETDELISKTLITEKRDASDYFKPGEYFTMSRKFEMFLREKYHEYNKLEFGILGWLRENIADGNYVRYFRQQELAEDFKTDQANISKSLKRLAADGIITKDKKRSQYVFSPDYVRYIFGDDPASSRQNAERIFNINNAGGE